MNRAPESNGSEYAEGSRGVITEAENGYVLSSAEQFGTAGRHSWVLTGSRWEYTIWDKAWLVVTCNGQRSFVRKELFAGGTRLIVHPNADSRRDPAGTSGVS